MNRLNVGYLRVSTEAQTEKYGLDLQKQKIIERANKDGATIDRWYIDGGYSGSKLDRPDIQRLLEDVEFGIVKSVYVYKLDRMSRDTIDALCFRRFIVNAKASERKESKKAAAEKEIKKTTYKLKKLYNLYVDSESETLFSIIQQEEKKRKLLEKELEEAIREESSDTNVKIEEIKRISNIWDDLTTKEQNRILKECVEKIVITDDNIDIHFRII